MSSAPGGLLPPLDPNPANANSSSARIMLATTLMFVSWMGFNMLTTPAAKPDAAKAPVENVAPAAAIGAAPVVVPAGTSDSLPEQEVKVAVDVKAHAAGNLMEGGYEATVSSHGAQLRRFALTGYYETKLEEGQKPGDHVLVDVIRGQHEGARFGALKSRGGDVVVTPDAPYEVTENTPTAVTMSRLTPSGVRITRRYTFNEAAFSTHIETTLKNEGTAAKNAELDMLVSGKERGTERAEGGMMSPATDVLGGACVTSTDRETFTSRNVEKDPADFDFKGSVRAASIDRHYFVGALTFDGVPTTGCTATSWKHDELSRGITIAVSLSPMPLAPGESKTIAQEAYLGPKQLDALRAFGHGQEEAIDFGFTAVLSRPLLWLLMKIKGVTNDFGLAIIGLTLCIFALALPLTHRSMVEMKKFGKVMKDLKPELDKLKEKYGHDQRLMMEKQQAFFTEKGVNPMANLMGCLPMFISMPIWIALYRMLSTSVELYQQPFHHVPGILDLTQPDVMVIGYPLLPFIVCGLMLVSALQQPPPEDQPQMKYVMYGMPVMFLFIMFNMASGLSIYMITNSLLRMAQSWYIKAKHG